MNPKPIGDSLCRSESDHEDSSEMSEQQQAQLQDADKQRAYEIEYRLQLRRRLCPGCGETDDIPL